MKVLAQVQINDTFFGTNAGAKTAFATPGSIISQFLPNIMVAAGVIFFLLILGGGFALIRSSGSQGSPQDAAKAKATVTFALVGFLLVVASYFILQIVQTLFGVNFVSPPTL